MKIKKSSLYKRLLREYLAPSKWLFIASVIFSVFYAGIDAYIIKLIKPLIDNGVLGKKNNVLINIILSIPFLFLFRGIFGAVAAVTMTKVSNIIIRKLRYQVLHKYLTSPITFIENKSSGELLSVINYNVAQLSSVASSAINDFFRESATIIFLILLMITTSPVVSLAIFIIGPIITLLFLYSNKRFFKISRRTQNIMAKITDLAKESVQGYKIIRVYGGTQDIANKFDQLQRSFNKEQIKIVLTKNINKSLIYFFGGFGLSIVAYFSLSDSMSHNQILPSSITYGASVSLFGAALALLNPLKDISNINENFQRSMAALETVFNIIDLQEEKGGGSKNNFNNKLSIEFNNLSFKYPNNKNYALNNISFSINAGEVVALVGSSGSGKSTLINLLLQFYTNYFGQIKLANLDIKDFDLLWLREQIAIVEQKVFLFNASIYENIVFGLKKDFKFEDVVKAVKKAQALSFIENLPQKFDTIVGEDGVMLSGGQRQRIAIARAILKDAPILLLDEATASLDSESESKIQCALDELMKNRTTIVIAHRLSTIRNANKIIVLDHGEISEIGSHQELLDKNGSYAAMHNIQYAAQKNIQSLV